MKLVCFLAKEKEGYGQISALVNNFEHESLIIVKDKSTENPFQSNKCSVVNIDASADLVTLKENMQDLLRRELQSDFEVALSLASGNGRDHMALVSALISVPVGVRFVVYTKKGVEFLS